MSRINRKLNQIAAVLASLEAEWNEFNDALLMATLFEDRQWARDCAFYMYEIEDEYAGYEALLDGWLDIADELYAVA